MSSKAYAPAVAHLVPAAENAYMYIATGSVTALVSFSVSTGDQSSLFLSRKDDKIASNPLIVCVFIVLALDELHSIHLYYAAVQVASAATAAEWAPEAEHALPVVVRWMDGWMMWERDEPTN